MKLNPEELEALEYLYPSPVFQKFMGWLSRMADDEVQRLVKGDSNLETSRGRAQAIFHIIETVNETPRRQRRTQNGKNQNPEVSNRSR